jgi:hypothetical protein
MSASIKVDATSRHIPLLDAGGIHCEHGVPARRKPVGDLLGFRAGFSLVIVTMGHQHPEGSWTIRHPERRGGLEAGPKIEADGSDHIPLTSNRLSFHDIEGSFLNSGHQSGMDFSEVRGRHGYRLTS